MCVYMYVCTYVLDMCYIWRTSCCVCMYVLIKKGGSGMNDAALCYWYIREVVVVVVVVVYICMYVHTFLICVIFGEQAVVCVCMC